MVQNKLHWAVSGKTAPEVIAERADPTRPDMGLTTWKGAKVRKGDVTVAKNYLTHDEMAELNRLVVMYLDYAEDQARRRRPVHMREWRDKLDAFLQFNERDILRHAGKVSRDVADRLALEAYEEFHQRRLQDEAQKALIEDDEELKLLAEMVERKPA